MGDPFCFVGELPLFGVTVIFHSFIYLFICLFTYFLLFIHLFFVFIFLFAC